MPLPPGVGGQGPAVAAGQDPAKKAAQEALQEALAAERSGIKAAAPEVVARWKVPQLPAYLDMETAVEEAMQDAKRFMNHRMQGEGVVLTLQQQPQEKENPWQALVVEDGTERVLQRYGGTDLLKLYAAHHLGRGVVVDGEV